MEATPSDFRALEKRKIPVKRKRETLLLRRTAKATCLHNNL